MNLFFFLCLLRVLRPKTTIDSAKQMKKNDAVRTMCLPQINTNHWAFRINFGTELLKWFSLNTAFGPHRNGWERIHPCPSLQQHEHVTKGVNLHRITQRLVTSCHFQLIPFMNAHFSFIRFGLGFFYDSWNMNQDFLAIIFSSPCLFHLKMMNKIVLCAYDFDFKPNVEKSITTIPSEHASLSRHKNT